MIVAVATPLVVAAEVLLLVFAGLFAVLLSSLADALVRMSPMRRGLAFGLTVVLLTATVGVGWAL